MPVTERYTEKQTTQIWQQIMLAGMSLVAEDGSRLEIIYPGRPNDGPGADFRDAVISTNEEIARGDVEIHSRSSGWYEHGHHLNPAYNRVILHVVMSHDKKTPTRLQDGRAVAVLALEKYHSIIAECRCGVESSGCGISVPCSGMFRRQNKDIFLDFIDEAGQSRFLEKAERFKEDVYCIGAGQALYRGIMGALGYSGNTKPFLELAGRLRLQTLESVNEEEIPDEEYLERLQFLLLGAAGLLQRRNKNGCVNNRAQIPERLRSILDNIEAMSAGDWRFYKVRPNNSPARRLAAMSCLLLRYREKGLLEGIIGLIEDVPASSHLRRLEKGLQTNNLGSGRAADITVNVLLPFAFAWSRYSGRYELEEKSICLYKYYPGASVNSVERHMTEQLGLSSKMVSTAMRQQGLMHIYNNLCIRGECRNCALADLQVGDNVQIHPARVIAPEPEAAAGGNHGGIVGAEFQGGN